MRAFLRAACCAVLAAGTLLAAVPTQPKALLPKVPLHTEYVVAVNKLGQVTGVISAKPSKDKTYNLQTYGNAMQAYIRTPDGKAISGRYRLSYDYSPKTTRIHRDVALVRAGGVNADAPGAVNAMISDVQKHAKAAAAAKKAAKAAATPVPTPAP